MVFGFYLSLEEIHPPGRFLGSERHLSPGHQASQDLPWTDQRTPWEDYSYKMPLAAQP